MEMQGNVIIVRACARVRVCVCVCVCVVLITGWTIDITIHFFKYTVMTNSICYCTSHTENFAFKELRPKLYMKVTDGA